MTVEERVALLAVACESLQADRPMPDEARALLARALGRWLVDGGDLDRHLGVRARRGSHLTPAAILRRLVVHPGAPEPPPPPSESRRFRVASSR